MTKMYLNEENRSDNNLARKRMPKKNRNINANKKLILFQKCSIFFCLLIILEFCKVSDAKTLDILAANIAKCHYNGKKIVCLDEEKNERQIIQTSSKFDLIPFEVAVTDITDTTFDETTTTTTITSTSTTTSITSTTTSITTTTTSSTTTTSTITTITTTAITTTSSSLTSTSPSTSRTTIFIITTRSGENSLKPIFNIYNLILLAFGNLFLFII